MALRFQRWGRIAAAGVAVAGAVVLGGWLMDIDPLKRLLPGLVEMNPLTALCFLLAGASLRVLDDPVTARPSGAGWRLAALGSAAAVAMAGLLMFLRYALGWDCGLDQLLFPEKLADEVTGVSNRMAPNTALAFLLAGAAILLVSRSDLRFVRAAQYVALLITLVAVMALLGYAYSATLLYGVASFIPMALPTALAFLALSLSLLFARPDVGLAATLSSPGLGGGMARRLLPAAVVLPAVLGGLRLAGENNGFYDTEFGVAVHTVASIVLFTALIWWAAGSLDQADADRRRAQAEIHRAQQELERAHHELKLQADRLREANQELEAFSYSVSHDLRAPLRHIHGFVDLLDKQAATKLDSSGRRYLKIISDAARKMGQLIDDLLVFSRMGRVALQKTTLRLEPFIREAIGLHQADLAGRSVDWVIPPLPTVEADPGMLRQVVANLVANAIKYTRHRAPACIEFGCRDGEPGEWVFYARDNGAGFDMRYAHKLFGVFQRLHSESEFEGTGIGLANVRRIITRHGGRTWAEGKVDEGATFYFSLPKPPAQPADSTLDPKA